MNMDNIKFRGQAQQDKFVCNVLDYKTDGYVHPDLVNMEYVEKLEEQLW
jgi:hypothetical protein